MSMPDRSLSFHRANSTSGYHHGDTKGTTYTNSVGWSIRHVLPRGGRRKLAWRYEVVDPNGKFMGCEPTFWLALDLFLHHYTTAPY